MKFLRLTIFMAHSMHIINMYSNINFRKISATVYEIFKKRKTGSSKMSNEYIYIQKQRKQNAEKIDDYWSCFYSYFTNANIHNWGPLMESFGSSPFA